METFQDIDTETNEWNNQESLNSIADQMVTNRTGGWLCKNRLFLWSSNRTDHRLQAKWAVGGKDGLAKTKEQVTPHVTTNQIKTLVIPEK